MSAIYSSGQWGGRHSTTSKDLLPSKIKPLPKCTEEERTRTHRKTSSKSSTTENRPTAHQPINIPTGISTSTLDGDIEEKVIRSKPGHSARYDNPVSDDAVERRTRKPRVTILAISDQQRIDGLFSKLKVEFRHAEITFDQLPYSALERYEFKGTADIAIVCHSIRDRRLSITNVADSLYDEFLPKCQQWVGGKNKLVVITHDCPKESTNIRQIRRRSFKTRQPLTFSTAGLVFIAGDLEKTCDIENADWDRLVQYLQVHVCTPSTHTSVTGKSIEDTARSLGKRAQRSISKDEPDANKSTDTFSCSLSHSMSNKEATSARSGRGTPLGPKIIHVCTSSEEGVVSGLIARLSSTKSNYKKVEARFLKIPDVRLDDFKFEKSAVKSSHGMVLCHSHKTGGFTVTDVCNALYNKYLEYCSSFFGKERIAVIVHDMTYPIKAREILMSRFRKDQPTASKLSKLVVLCGSLADNKNLEMSDEDWTSMQEYLEKI
ncbi:uncharacterized protein [Diadema antillarum]|uniref:uncharacterized protein n=1 Tax=Diadema antillarum TaxID=105358 RepID=UPI003A89331B